MDENELQMESNEIENMVSQKQEIEKSLKEKKEELKVLEEKEKQINKYFIGKYLKCLIIFTFHFF
jgi:hypothetical protein